MKGASKFAKMQRWFILLPSIAAAAGMFCYMEEKKDLPCPPETLKVIAFIVTQSKSSTAMM